MEFKTLLQNAGLTEEQINSIVGSMKENKLYTTSLENAEERYSKLKAQKEGVDTQLTDANTMIAELKKSNKDNEGLQAKVQEYEGKVTEYENKVKQIQLDYALDTIIKESNPIDAEVVRALMDTSVIKYENEQLTGAKEQIEAHQKSKPYLFNAKVGGNPPKDGITPPTDTAPKDMNSALTQYYQN